MGWEVVDSRSISERDIFHEVAGLIERPKKLHSGAR